MKISAQEEYGLRIMLSIARSENEQGLTISEISTRENISSSNTAKLLRILRMANLVKSTRGKSGGYFLARPAQEITIAELMEVLGGKLFDDSFCENYSGLGKLCTNSVDCSLRSLWSVIKFSLDKTLNGISLADLCAPEGQFKEKMASNF